MNTELGRVKNIIDKVTAAIPTYAALPLKDLVEADSLVAKGFAEKMDARRSDIIRVQVALRPLCEKSLVLDTDVASGVAEVLVQAQAALVDNFPPGSFGCLLGCSEGVLSVREKIFLLTLS